MGLVFFPLLSWGMLCGGSQVVLCCQSIARGQTPALAALYVDPEEGECSWLGRDTRAGGTPVCQPGR